MNTNQRRRTGRIHRHAGSLKIKGVGDSVGRNTERIAGASVGIHFPEIVSLNAGIIVGADSHKHTGFAFGQGTRIDSGIFQGFPGCFQQQALLRVHAGCFPGRNTKKLGVKLVHILNETAPAGNHFSRCLGIGVVEFVHVPAVRGHFPNGIHALFQ